MDQKERLGRSLKSAREMTEGIFATLTKLEEWTYQVHPKANHPLWVAGHLASTDNFFAALVEPDKSREIDGWSEKFGMGSQPTGNPADYPPSAEVLDYLRERRTVLLEVLDGLSEEDLARATPEGTPDFLPDVASVFETAVWHEGIHCGQLTIAHRALGHPPLFGAPQPAEA